LSTSTSKTASATATEAPAPASTPSDALRWQRAFLIACCAIIGAAFAYAACDWGKWTKLAYLPLQERATFAPPKGAIAMVYPGIILWGLGGLACGAIVGVVLGKIIAKPWTARTLHLFGAWAITAVLLAGTYYTWNLWPW
jgi:hypothetical protein